MNINLLIINKSILKLTKIKKLRAHRFAVQLQSAALYLHHFLRLKSCITRFVMQLATLFQMTRSLNPYFCCCNFEISTICISNDIFVTSVYSAYIFY